MPPDLNILKSKLTFDLIFPITVGHVKNVQKKKEFCTSFIHMPAPKVPGNVLHFF